MLIEDLIDLVKNNSVLVSLFTFFLGLLIGNWQAIGRDKRKEFNELTDALFVDLTKRISANEVYSGDIDTVRISTYLFFIQRYFFKRNVKQQRDLINQVGTYVDGEVIFDLKKLARIIKYQKRILRYLKRR